MIIMLPYLTTIDINNIELAHCGKEKTHIDTYNVASQVKGQKQLGSNVEPLAVLPAANRHDPQVGQL